MAVIVFDKDKLTKKIEPTHSRKLEYAIRDFITKCGGSYYDDELSEGVLTCYYQLNYEIAVEQKVIIRQVDYMCITTLSITLKNDDHMYGVKLLNLLVELNDINCYLDYGNFEYDMETGDIRFKSSYEPSNGIAYSEDLDKLLGYPRFAINKYGERIARAIE